MAVTAVATVCTGKTWGEFLGVLCSVRTRIQNFYVVSVLSGHNALCNHRAVSVLPILNFVAADRISQNLV